MSKSAFPSKAQATVQEMAKLTMMSGRINEIQEKNIKLYPFVVFDGIKSVSIDYDLDAQSETKRVDYSIVMSGEVPTGDDLFYRSNTLEGMVRTLFWKDLLVSIKINDILIYEGNK